MLALIAGTGDLPPALVARLPLRPLVCALAGFPPSVPADITFRIEHLGSFLTDLQARGVTQICMAGAVRRPAVDQAAIDAATLPLVPRIAAAMAQGDDGALRAIIAIFEEAGFTVKAAHEIAPDLLPQAGTLTATPVPAGLAAEMPLAQQTLAAMGAQDVGQACIIGGGRVYAREGQDGTDAMLARFAASDDPLLSAADTLGDLLGAAGAWLSGPDGAADGLRQAVLFKGPKPDQDWRADLPVIGPKTAQGAVAAGLAGIVIEAGGVIVLDRDAVISILDEAGLFLWARPRGAG